MRNITLKTKAVIANIAIACLVLLLNYFYITKGGLLLKTTASFGFVLLGLVNFYFAIKSENRALDFPFMMVCGLIFSMVGDVALNLHFIVGALIFAVGHVIYLFAYSKIEAFQAKDLIPMGIMLGISLGIILLVPLFSFDSALIKAVIILYALVISCMLGKAISNLINEREWQRIIILTGSILFYFSDFVLFLDVFGDIDVGNLCLATYYPAQILLAFSVIYSGAMRRS